MNKLISISLIVLYLASFSGMIWASDCKAQQTYSHSSAGFFVPCNKNTGHASNTHSHPLQQFCKLIEVHKEVLVSVNQQTPYYPATTATTQLLYPAEVPDCIYATLPAAISSNCKLFIQNRVLLI